MENKLSQLVSFFQNSPPEVDNEFDKNVIVKKIPKGQFIAMEGDTCNYLPIVKSGQVRVYKLSQSGQEMTLYRIKEGESCILTISCLLTSRKFPAIAFTESESEVILIDSNTVKNWVSKFSIWREYILDYMSSIILQVLSLLENTTFNRTELRVIDFLIANAEENGNCLKITHQHIASEIGTSREVVSRILKELETQKIIILSRGSIKIQNLNALKNRNLVIN
ncbi:MAG: Crp/Fnr family transcriptional regulator [Ignavibacteriae bacterium]|nr:Crp/Fnr family transcriptional regulator [Ignavibacteriota bacterium]MCB9208071.1 Crp/Fnr family transcriptional regulator [Ignavibacteriales bacterium]MCB9258837.1 Crp/Fnr family transcriptional regulator [Ignavibacteriales bacterium]